MNSSGCDLRNSLSTTSAVTSYSSNDDAACDDDVTTRTITERVAVAVTLSLVVVFTVGGNLLVCVTVMTIRALHSTTNYFILSLSLSDLLLGCLVNITAVYILLFHLSLCFLLPMLLVFATACYTVNFQYHQCI